MSTVRNTYFGGIVTDGMVLCLDAAKKESYSRSGTQWNDLSNDGHVGTLYGNPVFSNFDNGEFTFDGTGDYVAIPQGFGDFSSSQCCYEIWCYPTVFPVNGQIIWMDRSVFNGTTGVEVFTLNASGVLSVRGSSSVRVDSTIALNLNQWNHVVVNFNGSSAECYINNVKESLGSITSVVSTSYPLYVGRYPTIPNTYDWNGKISVTRVYNRNLSSDEVSKNFNALRGRFGI
jgi:hypothetical protein